MRKKRSIAALAALLIGALQLSYPAAAESGYVVEVIPETGDTSVRIDADRDRKKISSYIYGINDNGNIGGVSASVLKHRGSDLTSYNWETNYSNSGAAGKNSNDISLVEDYPSSMWTTPALYADKLVSRSRLYGIPVKLLTLPMMGYAANDSMGIVSDDENSMNTRWCKVEFDKNDTYLNQPDTEDGLVFVDEYVSYLVNRFGAASEGGINGYFLDSEPDKWSESFPVLGLEPVTFEGLLDRSANLAEAVKTIDKSAFVLGPSLSGLQGCVDLGNPDGAVTYDGDKEYSWFIDYYLAGMRSRSEEAGVRLLDCLDVHYSTRALTPLGEEIITGNDIYSSAYRMQAARTLWDPDYTENDITVMKFKQFTPVIPTLKASIRMNYPGTRLSFSEYNFGGGGDMSGAVAQIDALGVFASEEVYLACLSPDTSDDTFQKAAVNLFTNYDGKGTGFGDTLVYADNGGDNMSAVYAAADSGSPEKLRVILTNKQMVYEKKFDITLFSEEYSYSLDSVYAIDPETGKINESAPEDGAVKENRLSFTAEPESAYLLEFTGNVPEDTGTESESVWITEDPVSEDLTSESETESISETTVVSEETAGEITPESSVTETSETENPADVTVPDLTAVTDSAAVTAAPVTETTAAQTLIPETETVSETEENAPAYSENPSSEPEVPGVVKAVVSVMTLANAAGIVYIIFFDKR